MTTPTTTSSPSVNTGPGSVSFLIWLFGIFAGVLSASVALLQNGTPIHTAVFGGGGILLTLVTTAFKLSHDKGLRVAALYGIADDIRQHLPQLTADIETIRGFLDRWPDAQKVLDGLDKRFADLAGKITSVPSVASLVALVKQTLLTELVQTPVAS